MIIDNKKTAFQYRFALFLMTLFFVFLIVVVLLSGWFDKSSHAINKTHIVLLLLATYLLINFYNYIRDYNYIYVSADKGKLIVRYISLRIFTKRKNAIEIPLQLFTGYEIKKGFINNKLILQQKTKNGTAKYSPISISSLRKQEKEKLTNSLSMMLSSKK